VTGFGLDCVPVEEPGGCLFALFSLFGMKKENIKMKSALIIYLNSGQKRALLAEASTVIAVMKSIYINMREGGKSFKIDLRDAKFIEIAGNDFDSSEINIGVSGKKGKS
jgi:hypothetical protein